MRVKETTKKEIESRFSEMNDYMKIEYLSSCLKNSLDFDTRKFVLIKLSGTFETKGMLLDAGNTMKSAAEINTSTQNKINDFMKAVELFIRAGEYDKADATMKKTFSLLDEKQIGAMTDVIKEMYKVQAKVCIEKHRRKQAIGAYEKLLTFDTNDEEKTELQKKLLELYGEVGGIK